jgi:hypothetical protein
VASGEAADNRRMRHALGPSRLPLIVLAALAVAAACSSKVQQSGTGGAGAAGSTATTGTKSTTTTGTASTTGTGMGGAVTSTGVMTTTGTGMGGAATSTGVMTTTSSTTGTGGAGAGSDGDPATCAEAFTKRTYIGCDFWPTPVSNMVWSIFDYAVVVANAGTQTADVTVKRGGQTVETVQIAPGAQSTIYLPWVPELKGPDGDSCGNLTSLSASVLATGGAYNLVSTVPVSVYQFNAIEYQGQGGPPGKSWAACPGSTMCAADGMTIGCYSFTNDASLLLPSTSMTGNYRLTTLQGWSASGASEGAYFAVTGVRDGTQVTVTLPAAGQVVAGGTIAATAGGGTLSFSLNAGDVAEVLGSPTADNAGALIRATEPVQVISGMSCAEVPFGTSACDHLEQSVLPAETLGQHYFVTVPTGPRNNVVGHVVRLVGNVDGTHLTYPSGGAPSGAPATLDAGQVADLGQVTANFEVQGDQAFAVVDFMLGATLLDPNTASPNQLGDPSQSNAIPVEQYRHRHVFVAPTDYTVSYVDIVQPLAATILLDGQPLTVAPNPIGSSTYGIARQPLGPGNAGAHVLSASMPVGITVIGYGNFTSYMYPGGTNLAAIAPPP